MSLDEIDWLNKYNAEVLSKVGPLLRETGDSEAMEYVASFIRCRDRR